MDYYDLKNEKILNSKTTFWSIMEIKTLNDTHIAI